MASIFRRKYTLQDTSVLFSKWTFDPDLPLLQIRYRLIDTYTVGSTEYQKFGAFSTSSVNLMPPAAIVLTANVVEQVTEQMTREEDNREARNCVTWRLSGGGTQVTCGDWARAYYADTGNLVPTSQLPAASAPPDAVENLGQQRETRGQIDTIVTPATYRRRHEYDNGALIVFGPTQAQSSPAAPATPVAVRTTETVNVAPETSVVESRMLDTPIVTSDDVLYLGDRSNGELRVFTWPGRERITDRDIDISSQVPEIHGVVSDGTYLWLCGNTNIARAVLISTKKFTTTANVSFTNAELRGGAHYNGTLWFCDGSSSTIRAVNAATFAADTAKNLTMPGGVGANAAFAVGNIGWFQTSSGTNRHWRAFNLDNQNRIANRDIDVTDVRGEAAFSDGTYGYAIRAPDFLAMRLSDGTRQTGADFSISSDDVGTIIRGASRVIIETSVSTQYRRVDTYAGGLRIEGAWGVDAEPAANPVLMIASHELETAPMVGPRAIL